MMKRVLPFLTLLAAACGPEEPGRLPAPAEPADVRVSRAARQPASETFAARVVSRRSARVATRMSGTVEAVLADVGDPVGAGEVLLRLDSEDVEARLRSATARAELAEKTLDRITALAADGAASEHELDRARADAEAARGARDDAGAQLAYATVRAPFAGTVTKRSVDPGDLAVPGQTLLELAAPGDLDVVAELPGDRAGNVRRGESIRVAIPGGGRIEARVTRVAPALDDQARRLRLEAALVDPPHGLLPGSYARVEIAGLDDGPRWIPDDALVRRGQLTGVYALERDTLRLRWLRLGERDGEAWRVLAAPPGTLTVVRDPTPELVDGQPVGRVTDEPWPGPRALAAEGSVR